jgi:uncharacterized protein
VDWILLAALLFILAAYFIKGFSGFGPALIIVPAFTLLFNPITAVSLSSVFDTVTGIILLSTVFKSVKWRAVFPAAFFLAAGAYLGVSLLSLIPIMVLKIMIAIVVCGFIFILLAEKKIDYSFLKSESDIYLYISAAIAGTLAGMTGTGGPILVIFVKLKHKKDTFRSQIIAIFTIGAIWRLFLYENNGFLSAFTIETFIMIVFAVIGLAVGHFLQKRVNEQRFNHYVALILVIPVLTLLLEVLI